jgi:hypothetical protein
MRARDRARPRTAAPALAAWLCACAAAAACGGDAGPSLQIHFRSPSDPTLLDGVDNFLFSVADSDGRTLDLRRIPASAGTLRLDDVPFGAGLTFALLGLYGDAPVVAGRSCPADLLAGMSFPAVSMFVARVGTFSPTGALPADVGEGALVLTGGRGVLVAGGAPAGGGDPTAGAETYDARAGLWSTAAPLAAPRAGAAIATLRDGSQLVVGGRGPAGTAVAGAALYREGQGLREISADPALALLDTAAAALPDGTALVAGGAPAGDGAPTAAAWLFDGTGLLPAGQLVAARRGHTLSVVGSSGFAAAYAAGGYGADGAARDDIELFNPRAAAADPFRTVASARLADARAGHTATVLATGEILIVGGVGASGARLLTAEIFDPITAAIRPAGTLIAARDRHQATLLGDGRVLVTGGTGDDGEALSSAEIYDPQVGSFVAARPLGVARAGHAAAVLCDGTVLLVGGGAGAELYNPPR